MIIEHRERDAVGLQTETLKRIQHDFPQLRFKFESDASSRNDKFWTCVDGAPERLKRLVQTSIELGVRWKQSRHPISQLD